MSDEKAMRRVDLDGSGTRCQVFQIYEEVIKDLDAPTIKFIRLDAVEHRLLARRDAGSTPWTLLDYLPDDWLLFIDESHVAVPQVRGMYHGDLSRKQTLVDYGFRLPSALDNRPLNFGEFEQRTDRIIFTSATPGPYEAEHTEQVVEQIIRPTGLIDPSIEVKPTRGQIDDLIE